MFGQGNPVAETPHSVPHAVLRGDVTELDYGHLCANVFYCGERQHLEESAWQDAGWREADLGFAIRGDPVLLVRGNPRSTDLDDIRLNLFAVGGGARRSLYHRYRENGGWTFRHVGDGFSPPVFAVGQGDFRSLDPDAVKAHVFACRETDGHLLQAFWDGSQWIYHDHCEDASRSILPGLSALGLGDFSTGDPSNCRLFLFMRESDNKLVDLRWTGTRWLWNDHPGSPEILYAPDLLVQGKLSLVDPSRLVARLFVVDSTRRLMERHWSGTTWSWLEHPGRQVDGPPLVVGRGDAESTARGDIRIHVFVRSLGGELLERCWNGERWTWNDLGGNITNTPLEGTGHGDFASLVDADVRLRIFAHGFDGSLVEYRGPAPWSRTSFGADLTADLVPPLVHGDLRSTDPGDVRIHLFAVGRSQQLHEFDWDGTDWVTGPVH